MKLKKLTILIPCHNEAKSIGKVIKDVPKSKLKKLGYKTEIIVIDNNCIDRTAKIAKKAGAKIIREPRKGKGNAVRTGFRSINKDKTVDFVVMLDGDNTYKPHEIPRLIEPLDSGFCDIIIGSRLEGKINKNSMAMSHRLVNWAWTFFVRHFYGANVTDTCTGFFAWKAKVIRHLNGYIKSEGFAIEVEMITKLAKLGNRIYSVPITYDPRPGKSHSHLSPVRDGLKISWMLIKNLSWNPEKE
ncbi:MAG: glycosyltransferase family 2 protein [Candidatus Nanoarchaeia archaeon]|nr:glycosyltransferase family 2 protein [Candidatus Nanoarchaeia archaeon]MDD5740536.1 glycosyltransferase family 2 protein [Candidatus Nanoarchaeia archaeon]